MDKENWCLKFADKTGTTFGPETKVNLYDLINFTTTKEDSHKYVACLHNWDTKEIIDGYTVAELKVLKEMLEKTINKMESVSDSKQFLLFE